MTLDTTINLPTLVTLGLAIIAAIVWLVRLEGRVAANDKAIIDLAKAAAERTEERDRQFGALESLVNLTREQFHDYQLQVAREYTTHSAVGELKRDIITEIGRMEQRVENQITRLIEDRRP